MFHYIRTLSLKVPEVGNFQDELKHFFLSENGCYSNEDDFLEKKKYGSPKRQEYSMDCSRLNHKRCYDISKTMALQSMIF